MSRRLDFLRAALPSALVAALAACSALIAPASEPAASSIPYNILRVYAPADKIEQWPRGDEKYLPIPAADFERKWKKIQTTDESAQQNTTRITKAELTCRIVKDAVEGTAAWEIVHDGTAPDRVSLDPCELALRNARWEQDASRPVKLAADAQGHLSLPVERSGRLLVDFTLRAQHDGDDVISLPLVLPPCSTTQVTLDAPAEWAVVSDHGLVTAGEPQGNPPQRRFQIELGGQSQDALRLVPRAANRDRQSLVFSREQSVYDFSERGVNVTASFKLDVHRNPLRKFVVAVDAPLQMLSARLGEQNLEWSVLEKGPRTTRLEVDLGERAILGTSRWIEIAAMMAPPKGKVHLPRVRAENCIWQAGTSTLLVSAPLTLQYYQVQGGRQVKAGDLPAPASGESLETQWYSPQADEEVAVARRTDDLQVVEGTTFTLSNRELTARTVCELHLSQGDRFDLRPEIPRQWVVDSVDTIPAGGVTDWTIDERNADWQPLTIHLRQALRSNRPVKLIVQGRWRKAPQGEVLTPADLQLLRFPAIRPTERFVELRAADSFSLRLTDADGLRRVDPRQLTADESTLFRDTPTGVLFRKEFADAGPLKVEVVSRPERFDVRTEVLAAARGREIQERFSFSCVPKSGAMDSLRIEFPPAQSAPLSWKLQRSDTDAVNAHLLTPDERRAAGLGESGAIWEIKLAAPLTAPFTIQAEGAEPWTGPVVINLPTIPAAESQQGRVTVQQPLGERCRVENRRLKWVPAEEHAMTISDAASVSFQFDPAVDAHAAEPLLVLHPAAATTDNAPPAWAWLCRGEGRLSTHGRCECEATYYLENVAATTLHVVAPGDATLSAVTVNGVAQPRSSFEGKHSAEIPLPRGKRFPVVRVSYLLESSHWLFLEQILLTLPEVNVPVVAREVTGWLPAGCDGWSASRAAGAEFDDDLTWSQRLFGPLGQNRTDHRFAPWTAASWRQLLPTMSKGQAKAGKTQDVLLLLGHAASPDSGDSTWRAAIQRLVEQLQAEQPSKRLFVDAPALNREAVVAAAALPATPGDDTIERATTLLALSGLAVLVCDEGVLLTSMRKAVQYGTQLLPDHRGNAASIQPGPLADALHRFSSPGGDARSYLPNDIATGWIPAEIWIALGGDVAAVPGVETPAGPDQVTSFGWKAFPLRAAESATPSLWTIDHHTRQTVCWSLFLLAVGWGAMERRRVPALGFALGGLIFVAALVAPALVAPFFTAAFWGLIVGHGIAWTRGFRTITVADAPERTAQARPALATTITGAVILLFFLLLLAPCVVSHAEDVAAAPTPEVTYRVFIPVDDRGQPSGGNYYIPQALYDDLEHRAEAHADGDNKSKVWFESAEYSAAVSRDAATSALNVPDVKAVYRFSMTGKSARASIPWAGTGTQLLPESLTLDDRATQLVRADSGDLTFDVLSRGEHRLEIHWRPVLRTGTREGGFDLAVPAAASARLTLAMPSDVTEARFPSARGQNERDSATGVWSAQLGGVNRVSVRWSDPARAAASDSVVQADELTWLKILPGSVLIDLKYKLTVKEGRLREFRVALDPRLHLLPDRASDAFTVTQSEPVGNEPSILTFQFSRSIRDSVVVEANLLLTGTRAAGNLRLPERHPQNVAVQNRWLGVTVDPELRFEEQAREAQSAATTDFLAAWGATDNKPTLSRRLPPNEVNWNLTLRPQETSISVQKQAAWFLGAGRAHVNFAATASSTGGYRFQYRLRVPDKLVIDSVTVHEDDGEIPVRWARSSPGQLTVFLPSAAASEQTVIIAGDLPCPIQGDFAIPQISVEEGHVASSRAFLFRLLDVLTQRIRWPGMKEDAAADTILANAGPGRWLEKEWVNRCRLVGAWQGTEAGDGIVALKKNSPHVEVDQLLALEPDGEGWQAVVDCEWHVSGGKLDVLRWAIPNEWKGPFEITPPAAFEIRPLPGEDQQQLWIRPRGPLEGTQRVTIRGSLTSDQRVRLPSVSPLHVNRLTRWVALPALVNLQHLAWDVRNLTAASWPKEFSDFPVRESFKIYRAEGEHVAAVLKNVESLSGTPHVRLADYAVQSSPEGISGTAKFDVFSVGAATCVVELPDSNQLLDIKLNGAAAVSWPAGERRFEIEIGPTQLPQRIEVMFRGPAGEGDASSTPRLRGPVLVDFPVDATLWTVYGATPAAGTLADDVRISPLRGDVYRLKATAGSLENGLQRASRDTGELSPRWADPWLREGVAVRRQIARGRLLESRAGLAKAESELRVAEQHWLAVTKLLGADPDDDTDEMPDSAPPPLESTRPSADLAPAFAAFYDKGMPALDYEVQNHAADNRWTSVSHWLLAIGAAAAGIALLRRGYLQAWLARYPLPCAAAASIAWWLWLSPSALGLLLALACAVWSLRVGRAARRLTPLPQVT